MAKNSKFKLFYYCMRLQKKTARNFAIDAVFLAATVFSFVYEFVTTTSYTAISVVLVIISLIAFGYDFISIFKAIKVITNSDIRKMTHMDCVRRTFPKPQEKRTFEYIKEKTKNGTVYYSDELNEYLRTEKIPAKADNLKYKRVRENLIYHSEEILPFLVYNFNKSVNEGKLFSNDKKLCLSNDIEKNKEAIFHFGTYYDTYITNIICTCNLKSNADNREMYKIPEFPESGGKLKSVEDSLMNDEIGVSVVAFTEDNNMVLFRQNRIAQSSSELLVPTGSGSGDAADYVSGSLNDSVIFAMNRELREESTLEIQDSYNFNTKIIGYFRWAEKGGKPEFVGVTKLSGIYARKLSANASEVYGLQKFDAGDKTKLMECMDKIMKLSDVSVPLYMNLKILRKLLESGSDYADFIFGESAASE